LRGNPKEKQMTDRLRIPRDKNNDYTPEAARIRREFIARHRGAELRHVIQFSFDTSQLAGGCSFRCCPAVAMFRI